MRNPAHFGKAGEVNLTAFLSVFTPAAWLCLALLLVLVIAAHLATELLSRSEEEEEASGSVLGQVSSSVAFGYRALLQLDLSRREEVATGRRHHKILFLTVAAYALVAMAYYEGMLTSFMTARTPAPQLKTFADAVEFGYRVIVMDGSKHTTDLERAPAGSGRNLVYERLLKGNPGAYFSTFQAMAEALLEDPQVAAASSEFSFPDKRLLPLGGLDDAGVDPVAFALQEDSELLGIVNYNMVRMYQSGMLSYLQQKWVESGEPGGSCGCDLGSEEALALGYSNLLFPALILSCGGLLAPLILLVEAMFAKWSG